MAKNSIEESTALKHLASAVILASSVYFANLLEGPLFGLDSYLADLIGVALAVTIVFIADVFSLYRRSPLRRFFYRKLARFEGFWRHAVDNAERPASISQIYYSSDQGCWVQKGYGLGPDGKIVVSFRLESVQLVRGTEWIFFGDWSLGTELSDPKGKVVVLNRIQSERSETFIGTIIDDPDEDTEINGVSTQAITTSVASRISDTRLKKILGFVPKRLVYLEKTDPEALLNLTAS